MVSVQDKHDRHSRHERGLPLAAAGLHSAAILCVSFVVAYAVSISGLEWRGITGSGWAVATLLLGTTFLFLVGMYFSVRLTAYRSHADIATAIDATASDLASMRTALSSHLAARVRPEQRPQLASPPAGWIESRSHLIATAVRSFHAAGDLTDLAQNDLFDLMASLENATAAAREILEFTHRNRPSSFWFLLNVIIGVGGLVTFGPGLVALVLAVGGGIGAGKSTYDWIIHHIAEQHQLEPFWAIETCKNALKAELQRRGITAP